MSTETPQLPPRPAVGAQPGGAKKGGPPQIPPKSHSAMELGNNAFHQRPKKAAPPVPAGGAKKSPLNPPHHENGNGAASPQAQAQPNGAGAAPAPATTPAADATGPSANGTNGAAAKRPPLERAVTTNSGGAAKSPQPGAAGGSGGEGYKQASFRSTVVIPSAAVISSQGTSTSPAPGAGEDKPGDTPPAGDPLPDANFALSTALEGELFQKVEVTFNSKRDNIANEVMTSEANYLRSLTIVNELFRKPMLTSAKRGELGVSEDTVHEIFSRNFEDILRINSTLLTGLRERLKTWSDKQLLGDVLLDLTPFLKMYTQYTGNYERAVALLDDYENGNKDFMAFMAKAYENPIRQGQNLRSYLIMPIQRIPRYKLLIEDLVKNTTNDHPDYQNLTNALEKLAAVAIQVDLAILEQKNRQNLFRIQKKFPDSIQVIEPGRIFLKEGELTKICRKDHQKRYFYLFNDMLVYAGALPNGRYINVHQTSLSMVGIRDIPDDTKKNLANSFQLSSEKKSFLVYGATPEDKRSWLHDINKAIEDLDKKKMTFGKNVDKDKARLSTVAPVWVPDSESRTCTICGVRFTFTNRRHHCRQCGQIVCNKCSSKKKELPGQGKQRVCEICYTKPYEKSAAVDHALAAGSESDEEDGPVEGNTNDDQSQAGPVLTTPAPAPAATANLGTSSSSANLASSAERPGSGMIAPSPSAAKLSTGEIYIAQYDYVAPEGAASHKKLGFKAGDNLLVLQQDKSGWWLAELNKQRGWVPSSYLVKK